MKMKAVVVEYRLYSSPESKQITLNSEDLIDATVIKVIADRHGLPSCAEITILDILPVF